jgi:ABC-type bacteriocin/lantibiotic exporter with double-glycine peptidase domain
MASLSVRLLLALTCMTGMTCAPSLKTSGIPRSHLLNVPHIKQGKSECGPASLTMVLEYHGIRTERAAMARALHFNPHRGVTPRQLRSYPARVGCQVKTYSWWNGTLNRVMVEVARGRPIIVRQWYNERYQARKWTAHYRVVVGYDLDKQEIYMQDPNRPPDTRGYNLALKFTTFLDRWDLMTHPDPSFNWMLVIYK